MRIDPTGNFSPITPPPSGVVSRAANGSTPAPTDGEVFAPTSELAQLLAAARLTPEVRTDVIEAVATRLAAGELATPEAAAKTARALLNDGSNG